MAKLPVIAAVTLVVALGLGCTPASPERLEALLPYAEGVREGTPFRYRGIEAGRVEQLSLSDSGVRVLIRLARDDVPLRVGDSLAVRPDGIFGGVALEVVPGHGAAQPLPAGAVLPGTVPDTAAWTARAAMAEGIARAAFSRFSRDSMEGADSNRVKTGEGRVQRGDSRPTRP